MRIVLLLLFFMVGVKIAYANCLNNGDDVIFIGNLINKTYQSPDDVPEPVNRWVIRLDNPVDCFTDVDASFINWRTDVTVLSPRNKGYDYLNAYANKHVRIYGKVALAATAYHYTAILLLADKINVSVKNKEQSQK